MSRFLQNERENKPHLLHHPSPCQHWLFIYSNAVRKKCLLPLNDSDTDFSPLNPVGQVHKKIFISMWTSALNFSVNLPWKLTGAVVVTSHIKRKHYFIPPDKLRRTCWGLIHVFVRLFKELTHPRLPLIFGFIARKHRTVDHHIFSLRKRQLPASQYFLFSFL